MVWLKLSLKNREVDSDPSVRRWLDQVEQIMEEGIDKRIMNYIIYGTSHPEI